MIDVRQDPRFGEFEVLTPSRPAGQAARAAVSSLEVYDAEFETLAGVSEAPRPHDAAVEPRRNMARDALPGIDMLRQNIPFDSVSYSQDGTFSPGFVAFTAFSAIAVFWLCGGHVLLY